MADPAYPGPPSNAPTPVRLPNPSPDRDPNPNPGPQQNPPVTDPHQ